MRSEEVRLRALAEFVVREGTPLCSRVRGWSMHPTLRDGTEIRIEAAPHWGPGDVVAFVAGEGLLAHRAVHVDAARRFFVAHGDGCLLCDPPGEVGAVVGVVSGWRDAPDGAWTPIGAAPARAGWRGAVARAVRAVIVAALRWHVALARALHALLYLGGGRYLAASSGAR